MTDEELALSILRKFAAGDSWGSNPFGIESDDRDTGIAYCDSGWQTLTREELGLLERLNAEIGAGKVDD